MLDILGFCPIFPRFYLRSNTYCPKTIFFQTQTYKGFWSILNSHHQTFVTVCTLVWLIPRCELSHEDNLFHIESVHLMQRNLCHSVYIDMVHPRYELSNENSFHMCIALRGPTKTAHLWSGSSRLRFSAMKNPKGGLRPVFHLDLALTRMPSARATKLQSQYITCTETLITVITLIRFLHETPTDITL